MWSAECKGVSEENTGQNMEKGHWNSKTLSPYIPWHNYPIEKNLTSDPGFKPGTTLLEGSDITTEKFSWPLPMKNMLFCMFSLVYPIIEENFNLVLKTSHESCFRIKIVIFDILKHVKC